MKPGQVKQQGAPVEPYLAPVIEVLDIELQQNILQGRGNVNDFEGEDW
ncbi:MAG: hypothetical protein GX125_08980 [Bacteroidales bacterium]|jgi:hypothetical protein|nr:hypothetical protein [Bacteroidales bacterium]